ncbi:MAG: phytoene/squalene synthase family protein [Patulibacter minatonensis]
MLMGTGGGRAPQQPASTDALLEEARATHRAVGRTFWLASRFLPRELRDDVHLLYLVLRTLDDAVDDRQPEADAVVGAVEAWARGEAAASREAQILEALEGRYAIERSVVGDFCAGMRDDLTQRTILTEDDLDTYCYRVAGTVGLLMTSVLGTGDPVRARRPAIALGQAMQRTNILRDIDEDREHGRVYLARETIARFGAPEPGHRADLLRDQIARADALYDEGIAGIGYLASGNFGIAAAAGMYREILRELEREGLGERPGRAVVPLRRKVGGAVHARRRARAAVAAGS